MRVEESIQIMFRMARLSQKIAYWVAKKHCFPLWVQYNNIQGLYYIVVQWNYQGNLPVWSLAIEIA